MLPGPRIVLAAIAATFAFVVLAFAQLVKLQVAQSHSANFGPVEARFAGLAFAERADWTPVAPPRARSMEALAPFGNLPSMPPRRPDREAADAIVPIRIAAVNRPAAVASIAPAVHFDAPTAAAEPESASTAASPGRTAASETIMAAITDSASDMLGKGMDLPLIDVVALPPPSAALTPAVAAQGSVEVRVALLQEPLDPIPVALLAIAQAAVEPPKQVAALPDDAAGSDADANTETPADAQTASLPLPPPRPGLASLLVGEAVPVPAPRPNITFPVPRRVIRRSAAARPVRSTRPIDPLSALFGIGQPPGTVQR